MEPLLLFPDPPNEVLTQTLDQAGYPWKAAATPDMAARIEPEEGWAGAVIDATRDPEAAFGLRATRGFEEQVELGAGIVALRLGV